MATKFGDLLFENKSVKKMIDDFISFVSWNKGLEDLVRILIDRGADINAVDVHSNTALHKIAESRNINGDKQYTIAELLITNGANVNAKNVDDKTPIDLATNNKSNFTNGQCLT